MLQSCTQSHNSVHVSQVTKLFDKKWVLLKLNVVMTNYCSDSVQERLRPNPDLCKFISTTEMGNLAKEDLC